MLGNYIPCTFLSSSCLWKLQWHLPGPQASPSVAWMERLSCFNSEDFAAYAFKDFTTKQEQQCNLRMKPNNTSFQIETLANPGHMYISESIFQWSRGQSREFLPPDGGNIGLRTLPLA